MTPIPAFVLFTFHWYDGLGPPFDMVAVKVTWVPAHMVVPGFAVIIIDGLVDALIVITLVAIAVPHTLVTV